MKKEMKFYVLALTLAASSPVLAAGSGLSVTVEKQVCSQATGECSVSAISGMKLEVRAKPDVGIGDLVQTGVTGDDGKVTIALPEGTYQVLGVPVQGVCAYGWITGDPCIGPKFVVWADRETSLTASYTIWTDSQK